MPLKFSHKRMDEVPTPNASGRINQDLVSIKNEMAKLAGDMVLEIETGSKKAVRSTKVLITKAAKELDTRWRHWHVGSKVFARPIDGLNPRTRRKAP